MVRFMTPGQGRVAALAKGALRSRRRFSGAFDLAQLIEAGLMTGPRTGRVMVEHAAVKDPFPRFREHPLWLARASLLLELVTLTAAEHEPWPAGFETLRQGLFRLHAQPDQDRWSVVYAYRLLAGSGYGPGLDKCISCRRPPQSGEEVFSPAEGGVMCPACTEKARDSWDSRGPAPDSGIKISLDTLRTLTAITNARERQLSRILFTRNSLVQAREILSAFIAHQLGRPSRVLEFMERFRQESNN